MTTTIVVIVANPRMKLITNRITVMTLTCPASGLTTRCQFFTNTF